jgi:hypothetical protein
MHDELWAGIDLRLRNARKTLDDMRKVFQPAQPTHWRVVQESAGAIVGGPDWQQSFYQIVARLLAEVRAVPWIIEASFGEDRKSAVMSAWWADDLLPDEQQRRKAFSAQFKTHRAAIDTHPMTSEARDVAEHRRGFPEIEGRVIGPFGNVHIATPTERILDAESRTFEPNIANDPGAQWAATLPAQPIRPKPEQFTITRAKKPLFPECEAYLALAEQVATAARAISRSVHGANNLTPPPS